MITNLSHCLCSTFSEIFDVDWFISFLSKDVKIIKTLPRKGGKTLTPYTMRVPRKCSERCYQNRVLPVLLKRHVSFHFSSSSDCLYFYPPPAPPFFFFLGGGGGGGGTGGWGWWALWGELENPHWNCKIMLLLFFIFSIILF
jgi:hypothetical protein